MPQETFSSMKKFKKRFRACLKENSGRANALERYFSHGGIIRIDSNKKNSSEWPLLVYPTKLRLRALLKEKQASLNSLNSKKKQWERKFREAKFYDFVHGIKKFSQPLYWKHLAKSLRDKDYKEKAEKVGLPVQLVSDKRWQPMVRMFLEDKDYRKQLTETVENSIVYKGNKKVARYANELLHFRKTESKRKITELDKKINELKEIVFVLQELMRWASE